MITNDKLKLLKLEKNIKKLEDKNIIESINQKLTNKNSIKNFSDIVDEVIYLYYNGFTNRMICEYFEYGNINSLSQYLLNLQKNNIIPKYTIRERREIYILKMSRDIIDMYNEGYSTQEISKELSIYKTIVDYVIKKNKSKIMKKNNNNKLFIYKDLIKEYLSKDMKIGEILLKLKDIDSGITYSKLYYFISLQS